MAYVLVGIAFFIILFIVFNILYRINIKKKKNDKMTQIIYFVYKFKLDKEKINYKKFYTWISLINSLIISFVAMLIVYIDIKYSWFLILELLLALVLMLGLLYSLYEIYGRSLIRKWGKEDGNK